MSLLGAVGLLATFLLTALVTKVSTQQVQCFTASSLTTATGCESSDPSFIEECCVQSDGLFYRQTSGDQSCQPCIVFGWLDGSDISVEERGDITILEAGFIKGALFEQFLQQDTRGELRFISTATSGTAIEGANADFTVPFGSRSVTIDDATVPASIQTLIRVDRIALERPEDFTLTLTGANGAAVAALNAAAPNTFAIPTIRVVIEDSEAAVLQFVEPDYATVEGMGFIRPLVQLLTNIATDLTVAATPVDYTFLNDSQSPILDVIPSVANYDPRRPINATSVQDFSNTRILITFPAGNTAVQRVNIGIVDDDINEVEQLFVIFLEVVNPDRVDLTGRFATLGRIIDDDPLIIGFEQSSYTVSELLNATGELTGIPVIKGNNQQSELTFGIRFNTITEGGPSAANIDQQDFNRDILVQLIQSREFSPDQQSLSYFFELLDDDEVELLELFQVELSLEESGFNINIGGPLDDGSALFATTQIIIVDNDAIVSIGWEETFTSVNEEQGFLEICVHTLSVTGNVFPQDITITLAAITIRGTAADPGDYQELTVEDLFLLDITATINRTCIEVFIIDDDLLEDTERFTVQVVPDPFNHPTGLPRNFFLEPDLTVVVIRDNLSLVLCRDPAAIVNGIRTFTGNSVGDTTTYTCDPGFELIGTATITCTQVDDNNVEFSSVLPSCRPLCPDPAAIINGRVTFTGTSVGDTATYTCNLGLELIGGVTTTCTQVNANSAAFSPNPPSCRLSTQVVQCFTAPSTTIEMGCESSDPSFIAASIEECCVQSDGLFYRQTSGDQSCQACIVFGWLDGSDISVEERGDITILEAGFIKGALFEQFLQQDTRGELRFIITATSGTAIEGANADFTVPFGSRSVTIDDATVPAGIQTLIRVDRIALERPEDFTLTLTGANAAAVAALNAAAPNTFAIPTIRVVIEDSEAAVLQFVEPDYATVEGMGFIRPLVQLLTNIATDLTVAATPVDYTFLNDSQSPILDVIPSVANYDPRRPINATSVQDFSNTRILITFPAGNAAVQTIDIGIVDDDINEVEQLFVIFLRVVDAVNPDRVDLTERFATLGRIIDDDRLIIGFQQSSYTVSELNATADLTRIPVIKGNNQQSELAFEITINTITGRGPSAANINQRDFNRDIITQLIQFRRFSPDQQSLSYIFELLDDDEVELLEVFRVELSAEESGLNINLGGLLPDGSTLFATTQIFIVDDDAILSIGWEETFTSVNEGQGALEICVRTLSVTGSTFPPDNSITLAAITIRGTAADPGDYQELTVEDLFFTDITATNSRACIEVFIEEDDLLEATENFTVQVVPDPFSHPDGLPLNFFLEPDLTVVEIMDNDSVTIGFNQSQYGPAVDGTDNTLTVYVAVLEGALQRSVTVTLETTVLGSDTATADVDFDSLTRELTFDASTTVIPVEITINDDTIFERFRESFTTSLTRDPDDPIDEVIVDPEEAAVLIQEGVTIGIEQTLYNATEGADPFVELCAVLTKGALEKEAIVTFSTSDGSATSVSPTDYTGTIADLTFDGSTGRNCVNVAITDDDILEDTENFFGTLTTTDSGVTLNPDRAQVNIFDDPDDGVTIGFEQTVYSAIEGVDASVELCAVLKAGTLEREAVVTFSTSDGTATSVAPADYGVTIKDLTFDGSTSRKCVTVPIINDDIIEDTESFTASLTTSDSAVTPNPDLARVDIFEDPNDGVTIGFEMTVYSATEGVDASVELCAVLVAGTLEREAVVMFATSDGTATARAPTDYTGTSADLTFDGGTDRQCVTVPIINDDILEDTESFTASLTTSDSAVTLNPDLARVDISEGSIDVMCLDPPAIVNGMRTFTGNSVGDTTTYTCDSGFELIGVTATTCTEVDVNTAEFTPVPPVCRPLCPDPPPIVNGMRTFTGNSIGDTAIYPCDLGFELIGITTTSCTEVDVDTAEFTPDPPVCRPLCPDPPAIVNGMMTFTGNSVGDTATYTCNSGFELIGDPVTTCTQVNDDSAAFPSVPPPGCRPLCPDPPAIVNGMVTISGNSVGDTATYTCDPGFELIRGATTTCTLVDVNTAVFSPNPPSCRQLGLNFNSTNYVVDEDEGFVTVCVVKTGQTLRDFMVTFTSSETIPTEAEANDDFTSGSVTLNFPANEMVVCTDIDITDDFLVMEGDEQFIVEITVDDPVVVPGPPSTVTIIDNDMVIVEFHPVIYTINEADEAVQFEVVRRTPTSKAVVVLFSTHQLSVANVATSGVDYTVIFNLRVEIPPSVGEESIPVLIDIKDNNIAEGEEEFGAVLTLPAGSFGVVLGVNNATAVIIDDDYPGPVSNVVWDPQSDSRVKVSWSAPLRPNGIVLEYHLVLVNYIGGRLLDSQSVDNSTFMLEFNSEELEAGVPYRFTIFATNIAGDGEHTTITNFTQELIPSAPRGVTIDRSSGTQMTVSWIPLTLEEARSLVQFYRIFYSPGSSNRKRQSITTCFQSPCNVPGSESSVLIIGLDPSSSYSVMVVAVNGRDQEGEFSETIITQGQATTSSDNVIAIIGGVVAVVAVLLIIIGVIAIVALVLRYRNRRDVLSVRKHESIQLHEIAKSEDPDVKAKDNIAYSTVPRFLPRGNLPNPPIAIHQHAEEVVLQENVYDVIPEEPQATVNQLSEAATCSREMANPNECVGDSDKRETDYEEVKPEGNP